MMGAYVRQARHSRATGAVIEVLDLASPAAEYVTSEAGGRWMTACQTHGFNVQHETLALARSWAAEPSTWCEGCAALEAAGSRLQPAEAQA